VLRESGASIKDHEERFPHILDAIAHIDRYAARGRETFGRDKLVQIWIVRHIQIIGEAASRLSSSLRESYPEIPWVQIVAMRNILAHEYFEVDTEVVWATGHRDLPGLKSRVHQILDQLADNHGNDVGNEEELDS
jgi:uncharacterized protein with HEPN domain